MEITFLKDHLNNKAGDTVNVSNERGNYLIRTGAASCDKEAIKNKPKNDSVKFKEPFRKAGRKTKR